ncbi:hypothetical protein [Amaricoccus sp.]|uniref:hypothetical protein n=1 Tax=Amaricoccus sp. TaxID=1872485 RepID=UPI001B4F8699|nr:hypothetical protein [Amaricoccus sp.]MBP7000566.1 hypothetical protein [Amaricoccus sp.]
MTFHSRRIPSRPVVLELIARSEGAAPEDPISDEEYFLAQLRAAIVAGESPMERLRHRYGTGGADRLCRLYARYVD